MRILVSMLAATLLAATPGLADDSSLRGSPASMKHQYGVAKANDLTFLRTAAEVSRFAEEGWLVRIEGDANHEIARVSFPYGRPEMKLFLERLSAQYMEACGEKLVVTSLVRPTTRQPRNSHALSVHPTGMAVDLRVSSNGECVRWLESSLLSLEARQLLDVTREYRPPHFHIALFTDRYAAYAGALMADSLRAVDEERRARLQALVDRSRPLAAASMMSAADPEPESGPNWPLLLAVPLVLLPLGLRSAIRLARGL